MKICISSVGDKKESQVDLRFGRCSYFVIYDLEKDEYQFLSNEGVRESGGAGIKAAGLMLDNNVEVVITGNLGPNAMRVLGAGKVKLIGCISGGTIQDQIQAFKSHELHPITDTVQAHFGMGNQHRHGQRQQG